MAGIGPPPKPGARQPNRGLGAGAQVRLPASGRPGKPPRWPLPKTDLPELAAREAELWAEIWRTPQAVAWERLRWTHEVAQYVRWRVLAERGGLDQAKEARQLADRLGLSPLALLRLRWQIVDDEAPQQAEEGTVDIRERLKAVG